MKFLIEDLDRSMPEIIFGSDPPELSAHIAICFLFLDHHFVFCQLIDSEVDKLLPLYAKLRIVQNMLSRDSW
jgi:hypothetical protein